MLGDPAYGGGYWPTLACFEPLVSTFLKKLTDFRFLLSLSLTSDPRSPIYLLPKFKTNTLDYYNFYNKIEQLIIKNSEISRDVPLHFNLHVRSVSVPESAGSGPAFAW